MPSLHALLVEFQKAYSVFEKGGLSIVLIVSDYVRQNGLPSDPSVLKAPSGTQVKGASKAKVQSILARHGETRVLSQEGGRTSRGSVSLMEQYVAFLRTAKREARFDANELEAFWVNAVRDYFDRKPFTLKSDRARSLKSLLQDLFAEADSRTRQGGGMQYKGAMMQHLVGAKLRLRLGANAPIFHGSFAADQQRGRLGDFEIGNTAIHVTVTPALGVMQKVQSNLEQGVRPLIVTTGRGVISAENLAEGMGILGRIEIFELEQFLISNLMELGGFQSERTMEKINELVRHYNDIIDEVETDKSLKIEFD